MHYWGLRAIADRLGYRNEHSVYTLWQQQGFPMFKRRGRHRMYRRHMWYTNDQLITVWELSKVQDQRRQWQRTGTTRAFGRERARPTGVTSGGSQPSESGMSHPPDVVSGVPIIVHEA